MIGDKRSISIAASVSARPIGSAKKPLVDADGREEVSIEALPKLFAHPTPAYRGKPFWSWNGTLRRDELLRQVGIMREMGMGGAFMHSRTGLKTPYLGEEWFELINACADECEALGLEGWLYDEDRWPSGSAGGLATVGPEFRMRYLRLRVVEGREFRWPEEEGLVAVFAAKVDGLELGDYRALSRPSADGGEAASGPAEGEKVLLFTEEVMPEHSFYNGAAYLDTMNARATQHFIAVTHERYREACGPRLGAGIRGIFTDEPHRGFVMCDTHGQPGPANPGWATPWTGGFPAVFEARFGYDLRERLPELFLRKEGCPVSPVKWCYMELAQTLFLENWAKPLHAWCRKHGLRLTGHVLHEDSLGGQAVPCGAMMRYYEHMDVPGVDVLGRDNRNHWIVKQLASVARQRGKRWMLSELYGCTGWQMDFAGHKEIGDWQAFLGINVRCHHLSWFTMAGEAKRDYPASIFFQSSWYREYKAVEDYYARLHVMLMRGEAECDLLVVHPVESLWAQVHVNWATWLTTRAPDLLPLERDFAQTYRWLTAAGVDFDYGDEDHLSRFADVEGGLRRPARLRVGRARYRAVLVAGSVTLRGSTIELLESFAKAGGVVIFAGPVPAFVDARDSSRPARLAERTCAIPLEREALRSAVRRRVPGRLQIAEAADGADMPALVTQLRRDGDSWIVALHHPDPVRPRAGCRLSLDTEGRRMQVQEWDARTGRRHALSARFEAGGMCWETSLAPLGERLFVVTPRPDAALAVRPRLREVARESVGGPFAFELDEPNALVLDRPAWRLGDGEGSAWAPPTEILRIDESVRDRLGLAARSGMMVQPWARAEAAEKEGSGVPLRLRHVIHVREVPTADVVLVLESPEAWHALLNGRPLELADAGWFIDPALRRIVLPPGSLRPGENVLELCARFHADLDLEACYLLGDFGVWLENGVPAVGALPAMLEVGDVTAQGLPFYTGRIGYRVPVPASTQAGREGAGLRIELPGFGGAVAVLRRGAGDGRSEIMAFPPYAAELGCEREESEVLTCELVLTRRNLFGPLHLLPKDLSEIGPASFRTAGESFSDDYQLFPSGLLESPVFVTTVSSGETESPAATNA